MSELCRGPKSVTNDTLPHKDQRKKSPSTHIDKLRPMLFTICSVALYVEKTVGKCRFHYIRRMYSYALGKQGVYKIYLNDDRNHLWNHSTDTMHLLHITPVSCAELSVLATLLPILNTFPTLFPILFLYIHKLCGPQ